MNTNNNRTIFIAVLIGALVGVVAGVLFAPEKGKITREKVLNWFKKIKA